MCKYGHSEMSMDQKIITDYLNNNTKLKQKKSHNLIEDNRETNKKLLIGRISHICQTNNN